MITHRHPFVATAQLLAGAALLFCIWQVLPTRYVPVDALGSALSGALVLSGLALLVGRPWGKRIGRAVSLLTFALGACTVVALAFAAGELFGLYGPVGQGGAVILGLTGALLFAYFVALPGLWLAALSEPVEKP